MRAARAGGLPVPDVQATGTFEGAPFFVLEWMGGVTAVDMALKAPWRMARVARALGAAQARFHAIPPPAGLPERGTAWIEATIAHPGLRAALLRESRADTFCHLDFHPLNVLGQGTTVTAILDFAAAGVSDRRADLAFTNTALLDIPAPPGPTRPVMQLLRRVYNKNWRKGYASVAGSFPLTPLFEALGIYYYFGEVSRAVEEKRGWVQARELDALRKKVSERLRAAGLDD